VVELQAVTAGTLSVTPLQKSHPSLTRLYMQRFNIRTGAHFFSQTLADNGGNVLTSIGMYNGWYPGLTYVRGYIFPPSISWLIFICTGQGHRRTPLFMLPLPEQP
jgi:hypothetical protein